MGFAGHNQALRFFDEMGYLHLKQVHSPASMCSWFHVLPSATEVRFAMPVIW